MNQFKNSVRKLMNQDTLTALMRVRSSNLNVTNFCPTPAIQRWMSGAKTNRHVDLETLLIISSMPSDYHYEIVISVTGHITTSFCHNGYALVQKIVSLLSFLVCFITVSRFKVGISVKRLECISIIILLIFLQRYRELLNKRIRVSRRMKAVSQKSLVTLYWKS